MDSPSNSPFSFPDAAPCIDMPDMPSIHDPDIGIHHVPLVRATAETILPFGRLVADYDAEDVIIETWPQPDWRRVEPGTGNEGGIHEGDFLFRREGTLQVARNLAVGGHYITGWFEDPAVAAADRPRETSDLVYVREANYHPDGGQVFFPVDGNPFIALLASPEVGDNVTPDDFKAFYFDGSQGIQIWPGTWHQPLYPIADSARFRDKQGKVHACIACDMVREFGRYLAVPLMAPKE